MPLQRQPRFPQPLPATPGALSAVIAYNRFGGYAIPNQSLHRPAAQAVLAGGVWEEATIACMIAHAGDGDIVHAGTYFGDFLPALSAAIAPAAKIWAFEPIAANHACAAITMRLNGLANVELTQAALGCGAEMLTMVTHDARGRAMGGGSHVAENPDPSGPTERVRQILLDDAIPAQRNVTVLQLDVENFEKQALSGALALLARCKPLLILETVPQSDWFAEHIGSLGYAFQSEVSRNSVFSAT